MHVKQSTTPVLCGVCEQNFTTQTATIKVTKKNGREIERVFPCCLNSDCRNRVYHLQTESQLMEGDEEVLKRVRKYMDDAMQQEYEYVPSFKAKKKVATEAKQATTSRKSLLALIERLSK